MTHRVLPLFAAFAFVLTMGASSAEAKRAMPPKTKICNKTKKKQYVSVMNYAGRGHQSVKGWTFIAPGTCHVFQDDRFFVRGKAKVTGLQDKYSRKGCIKTTKVFRVIRRRIEDKDACKADGGRLVVFRSPVRESMRVSKTVFIGK